MDYSGLKEEIKKYGHSIGLDKIGFTDARPLTEHLPRLLLRKKAGYAFKVGEGAPEKRIDPTVHLHDAKSVISAAVAYPAHDAPISGQGSARGRMSFIARGTDYHIVLRHKLETLRKYILTAVPQARAVIMVDKEEILEKAIAVRAGLGWFGKNTLLVTPEYGSWVCLGELVTDIPFTPDLPLPGDCGECRACIDSCPTQALDKEKNLNPDRCLAAVTLSKQLPPDDIRALMGNALYGCDICQLACPRGRQAEIPEHAEFAGNYDDAFPPLADMFALDNDEFRKRFGHTSGAWRGRLPIQRNAVIAAGNMKDAGSVPVLIKILKSDTRSVMRGAAAWALGRIGAPGGLEALECALDSEKDPSVADEIRKSLERG